MRFSAARVFGYAAAILFVVHASPAVAQCLTKPAKIDAALNGKDAYALAKAEAVKMGADAVPTKFTTLLDHPLDAQGRSTNWSLQFFSATAKKLLMITLEKGAMTCFAIARDAGGRAINVTDKTVLDTKLLLDAAQAAGGSKHDPKTVTVAAGLNQNPQAGALWYLTYETITPKKEVLQVILDSTGKVSNVFVK
jgi:hypothetical protein